MILTIDIGNTTIGIGVFSGSSLCFCEKISSTEEFSEREYIEKLNEIFASHNLAVEQVKGSILSSVVPRVTEVLKRALEIWTRKTVLLLSCKMELGFHMAVEYPEKVGCDRLADVAGAISEYPLPLITIDMGTATTINVVDKDRTFRGGIIMPGVGTAHKALLGKTAQLPSGDMDMPTHTIGANTQECITSGMVYGNACAIDGLIARINEELVSTCTVIATGGYAHTVIPHCRSAIVMDDCLLMKGLKVLYDINQ
ncbi:MAG: type III pantothenate kinase [Lachnospiraceae bacterium]|nr:type III pantothenate kinase [Lachnospiraceae bacterium]